MSTTGDILMAAIKQFDEKGWCVGELESETGAMCAAGVLSYVLMGRVSWQCWEKPEFSDATQALADHLPVDFVAGHPALYRVVTYNNTRTDYSEIRDWFEKAALDEGVTL